MKSKIDLKCNNSLKNLYKNTFGITLSNGFENINNKIIYYRNNLFGEKYSFGKTYHDNNNNENLYSKKYYNSNNINDNNNINILDSTNIGGKNKLKRSINSASVSLIRGRKIKYCDNSSKILLKNNYNIRKIHDIISTLETKLNLLHNINKCEKDFHFLYQKKDIGNMNNNRGDSNNKIIKKSNKRKVNYNCLKTIYKSKNLSFLPIHTHKENFNTNNIMFEKLNKNELIPYPYKRMQKKLRKFFAFPKNMKFIEEQFPYYFVYNKFNISRNQCNNNKVSKNKINFKSNDNDKFFKNSENIKMEDKSINTDSTLLKNIFKNIKSDRAENKIKDKLLFNNKLIILRTKNKDNKDFVTTSNNKFNHNKNQLDKDNGKNRAIHSYQKNIQNFC